MADATMAGNYGVGLLMEQPRAPELAVAVPQMPTQDVIINKVSNGFIVRIGCKVFVAKTWAEVSEALALYWKNPNAARAKYCEDEVALKPNKRAARKINDLLRGGRRQKRSRR